MHNILDNMLITNLRVILVLSIKRWQKIDLTNSTDLDKSIWLFSVNSKHSLTTVSRKWFLQRQFLKTFKKIEISSALTFSGQFPEFQFRLFVTGETWNLTDLVNLIFWFPYQLISFSRWCFNSAHPLAVLSPGLAQSVRLNKTSLDRM